MLDGKEMPKRKISAKEKTLRSEIKRDLLLQLEDMETRGTFFEDMVEDYMSFWDVKNDLIHDIKTRGVVSHWRNSETQYGHKKNDSVSELVRVNAQMLKILHQLNIKTDLQADDDDDDY